MMNIKTEIYASIYQMMLHFHRYSSKQMQLSTIRILDYGVLNPVKDLLNYLIIYALLRAVFEPYLNSFRFYFQLKKKKIFTLFLSKCSCRQSEFSTMES